MPANSREIVEGDLHQGEDEIISYTLDVTSVGDSPTDVAVVVKDTYTGAIVTSTVMPVNSPSVSGNVITLSPLKLLTRGHIYRVEVKYTIDGNVLESYFHVHGQE